MDEVCVEVVRSDEAEFLRSGFKSSRRRRAPFLVAKSRSSGCPSLDVGAAPQTMLPVDCDEVNEVDHYGPHI